MFAGTDNNRRSLSDERNRFEIHACGMAGVQAVFACSERHFARHTHDQFGIGIIVSGAQKSASGRGMVEAVRGDVITVNPGEVHDGRPLGDHARIWQMLYFEPDILSRAVTDIKQGRSGDFEFTEPVISKQPTGVLVRQLLRTITTPGFESRTEELLLTLLFDVAEEVPQEKYIPEGIRMAKAWIDDDPGSSTSLAELSALAGLSRFQFLRAFAQATGLTPHAYLLQRRIQLARRLIVGGTRLADAAIASGFADQSHMTRVFVRSYGVAPGLYAKALR